MDRVPSAFSDINSSIFRQVRNPLGRSLAVTIAAQLGLSSSTISQIGSLSRTWSDG